jgi:hypothetical protein
MWRIVPVYNSEFVGFCFLKSSCLVYFVTFIPFGNIAYCTSRAEMPLGRTYLMIAIVLSESLQAPDSPSFD